LSSLYMEYLFCPAANEDAARMIDGLSMLEWILQQKLIACMRPKEKEATGVSVGDNIPAAVQVDGVISFTGKAGEPLPLVAFLVLNKQIKLRTEASAKDLAKLDSYRMPLGDIVGGTRVGGAAVAGASVVDVVDQEVAIGSVAGAGGGGAKKRQKKKKGGSRAAQQRQQQQETCYPLVAIKFASMSSEKMDGLSIGLVCSNLHDILENNDDFRARSSENAR